MLRRGAVVLASAWYQATGRRTLRCASSAQSKSLSAAVHFTRALCTNELHINICALVR